MNKNHNYPKNEMEFYCREYSVDDLVNNYKFDELIAYYIYGLKAITSIQQLIDNNIGYIVNKTNPELENDKTSIILRGAIVKNALRKMNTCDIIVANNNVFVINQN